MTGVGGELGTTQSPYRSASAVVFALTTGGFFLFFLGEMDQILPQCSNMMSKLPCISSVKSSSRFRSACMNPVNLAQHRLVSMKQLAAPDMHGYEAGRPQLTGGGSSSCDRT